MKDFGNIGPAKFVEWASRSYVQESVDAGVKVYLYKPVLKLHR